jgi:hypothetical protein
MYRLMCKKIAGRLHPKSVVSATHLTSVVVAVFPVTPRRLARTNAAPIPERKAAVACGVGGEAAVEEKKEEVRGGDDGEGVNKHATMTWGGGGATDKTNTANVPRVEKSQILNVSSSLDMVTG